MIDLKRAQQLVADFNRTKDIRAKQEVEKIGILIAQEAENGRTHLRVTVDDGRLIEPIEQQLCQLGFRVSSRQDDNFLVSWS